MDRQLQIESVEGEIALVIAYQPGKSEALGVLAGVMRLIESLDALDHCLLSSIDSTPPTVAAVREALDGVAIARATLPGQRITIQTELGDIDLAESVTVTAPPAGGPQQTITNNGVEFFKVKAPDMLGASQWTVLRNNRSTKVDMLHQSWLDAYHARQHSILPGDSLKCQFEESVTYDELGNEMERKLAIIEVLAVITPPLQRPLI